jgi:hypothetical protein
MGVLKLSTFFGSSDRKKNRRRITQKCLALSEFSVYLLVISPLPFFAYHDATEYTP